MSPRKLVFMNHQAHWICQCRERHEPESRDMERDRKESFNTSHFICSGYPDLVQLSELLCWYNVRDLTYPGDVSSAISGPLAILSRGFEGGFLYGLPEYFFDVCLGWRPYRCKSSGSLKEESCRQKQGPALDCKSRSTTTVASEMPSWSWTAWQRGFSFERHEAVQIEIVPVEPYQPFPHKSCQTTPITEWYTGGEPSDCDRRRIMSEWHVDRKDAGNQDEPLPEGWTRVESTTFSSKQVRRGPQPRRPACYRHQGSENAEPTFRHYPFRKREINDFTPFMTPGQTRYLFCKTWKASVLLFDVRNQGGNNRGSFDMQLWTKDLNLRRRRSRIGAIWLHNAQQFDGETDSFTESNKRMALVDVVAISRCSSIGQGASECEDEDGDSGPLDDKINVLWVKWDQGIAYRLASGFVYEEDWKRLDPQEIDLVLG